jgi:HTH-type transcriptional regulator/antitoxin HigA
VWRLPVEYLQGVIRSEKENMKAIEFAGRLMKKGKDGRSPEEERLLDLLVTLIEDFEEKAYPIGPSSPAVAVRELMREHGLKQTDMLEIFGSQAQSHKSLTANATSASRRQRNSPRDFTCPLISLFNLRSTRVWMKRGGKWQPDHA